MMQHSIYNDNLFIDGVLIAIECKAWAENIIHDRMERKGLAHFEVTQDFEIFESNN